MNNISYKIVAEKIFNAIIKDFNKDGFSSPLYGELKRYVVSGTHNQTYTLELLCEQVEKFTLKDFENVHIGGWTDSETGINYLDIGTSFDELNSALAYAKSENQIAIYDLEEGKEIRIKSTLDDGNDSYI